MSREYWNFHTAGRLVFGDGAVQEVGPAVARLTRGPVFVVTDATLVSTGQAALVIRSLTAAGIASIVFEGGEPEPTYATAEVALAEARRSQPTAVVAIGGGSNMDLAKMVAVVLTHGGSLQDYAGFDLVPGPLMPLICVSTTAGTGSEVSHAAVLTNTAAQLKVSTQSQFLRPTVAIVDPELTWSCPPRVTAHSGIDALTHAIEALCATHVQDMGFVPGDTAAYEGKHPLGDLFAREAIRLIGQSILRAVEDPTHREARRDMAYASTLAGLAFSNCGVALVHAMEYPVGGAVHVSHGEGNGLLLPYVMEFIGKARPREFAAIASGLGYDAEVLSDSRGVTLAIEAVTKLRSAIGVRSRLRELGVTREQLPAFAQRAFAIKRLLKTTPVRVAEGDILAIYQRAW